MNKDNIEEKLTENDIESHHDLNLGCLFPATGLVGGVVGGMSYIAYTTITGGEPNNNDMNNWAFTGGLVGIVSSPIWLTITAYIISKYIK